MDAYDRLAKVWHSCRACAEIDQDCPRYIPEGDWDASYGSDWDASYEFYVTKNPWWSSVFNAELSNQLEDSCTPPPLYATEPYEGCKRMMCECDLRLAQELSKLYMSGNVKLNDAYVSENGFDHATHCVAQAPGRGGVRQCCGQYPNRGFFNTDSQKCCDNTVVAGHNMC